MLPLNATTNFSLSSTLETLEAGDAAHVRERLDGLKRSLYDYSGYYLREDSKLAYLYATHQLPFMTEREVCHEMSCMQFLCERTPYSHVVQHSLRLLASEVKRRYNISWTDVWRIVSKHGPDVVKMLCLHDSGLQFPDFEEEGWTEA